MPSGLYLWIFAAACGCLTLLGIGRSRSLRRGLLPASSHRCRARPLFSHLGRSSFRLDALVEVCDDPGVPRGWPFSLRLIRPARRHRRRPGVLTFKTAQVSSPAGAERYRQGATRDAGVHRP